MSNNHMKPSLGLTGYSAGIIVESWRLWEQLSKSPLYSTQTRSFWWLDADYFELTFGDKMLPVVIAQGASMVADATERLAGSGAQVIIRLGTTGGLSRDSSIGDLVIPFSAIRDEGTSGFYLPAGVPAVADLSLVLALCERVAGLLSKQLLPTLVWSTDGRWVESAADIELYSTLNVQAVDMESAALFAVGMKRGVKTASVSVITDVPIRDMSGEQSDRDDSRRDWNRVLNTCQTIFPKILEIALLYGFKVY